MEPEVYRIMSAAASPQKQTSQARIDANRRNAQKSTGPRTAEGKHRVSQNAATHGLTARHLVLAEESAPVFYTLRRKMLEELQPQGEIECQLAEQMIAARWRLMRAWETETELYNRAMESIDEPAPVPDPDAPDAAHHPTARRRAIAFEQLDGQGKLQRLDRYEARLSREYDRCLRRLTEMKAARCREQEQRRVRLEQERRPPAPLRHADLMTAGEYIRLQRKEIAPLQNKPNTAPIAPVPASPGRAD